MMDDAYTELYNIRTLDYSTKNRAIRANGVILRINFGVLSTFHGSLMRFTLRQAGECFLRQRELESTATARRSSLTPLTMLATVRTYITYSILHNVHCRSIGTRESWRVLSYLQKDRHRSCGVNIRLEPRNARSR
jgi:hypothetical protein